ncbi:MAG: UDP-N-acetylmuramate dehydrogenase [Lachnospiraceae bacterium]|nr:UDP-N-acetylmuramate dehydrogenase [Lachnospiraceae bacterium]
MRDGIAGKIEKIIPKERVLLNESMKGHTTFRAGGNADIFAVPANDKELSELISLLNEENEEYIVIGNGSNLLVGDKGYRGVCIQISEGFEGIEINDNEITAGSGAILSKVADKAMGSSLTGFEFASGIPGTVGGAMVMNAGAYGGEMKDVVSSVEVLTKDGTIRVLSNEEMEFSYRNSIVRKEGLTVLKVVFKLERGSKEEIRSRMVELAGKRRDKQPLEYPSAGSTFKRPEGNFAGKLIMEAGLAGYSIGGARVSEKHCGFIINTGGATARDIYDLIYFVQNRVYENSNIRLEPEVCMIGEF